MSTFNGSRRGPNVSQYLRNLNVQDAAIDENFITNEDFEKQMAMFTNTVFTDPETGENQDFTVPPVKPETTEPQSATEDVTSSEFVMSDFSSLEFMSGDFNFGDFGSNYTSPTIPNFQDNLGNLQPIQPNPQAYQGQVPQLQPNYGQPLPRIGADKGKAQASSPGRLLSFEEASRLAAEEDKRKRNTAASARFRIKKKQREQALEKSAKEMGEKVSLLEGRIHQLETENKFLKDLIIEKNDGKQDVAKLLKDFVAKDSSRAEAVAKAKAKERSKSSSSSSSSDDSSIDRDS